MKTHKYIPPNKIYNNIMVMNDSLYMKTHYSKAIGRTLMNIKSGKVIKSFVIFYIL